MQIVFRLTRQQAGNAREVGVRVYHGSFNHSAMTGIYADPAYWNEREGRCNISRRFETPANQQARHTQQLLDHLADYLVTRWQQDTYKHATWLKDCINDYNHPHTDQEPLRMQIPDYCAVRRVAPATRKKLTALAHLLLQYEKAGNAPLTRTLTRHDLDTFYLWLLADGTRSENSAHCRLRQLRTILYWQGKPHPNPFDEYVIPADAYGTPIYLTREERDYVAAYSDLTPAQSIQRDIFIFQCHTGCRVGDLLQLRPTNVRDGWLVYVPNKTSRANPATIEVPLSETAQTIIERYKGHDLHGRLLPFVSAQAYGRAIHNILRACACDRPVAIYNPLTQHTQIVPLWQATTSHTARKTFTQILYAATGNKRLVASLTGHSENSQAFNRYSEITRDIKQSALAHML